MRSAAALPLLMLIATGCASNHRATLRSHRAAPSPAARRQACVERWNWLHYDHRFVGTPNRSASATVKTTPCRIEIDYRLSRSDSAYKSYLGMYFPCVLNRFEAYDCAEHAYGLPGDPPRRGQNAEYFAATGVIRLSKPPAQPVSVPKPGWVRRYPVTDGFIDPFDASGKWRPGLRLVTPPHSMRCGTFPGIERSRLLGCGAGLHCFVPRLPVHNNELIACPTARGSRIFRRGRLIVYPNP